MAERWVLFGLVAGATALFLAMIAGLLMPIFFAIVLSILFYPIYRRIERLIPGHENIASALTLAVAFSFVALPTYAIGTVLVDEAFDLYQSVSADPGGSFENVLALAPAEFLASRGIMIGDVRAQLIEGLQALSASVFSLAAAATTGTLGFLLKIAVALYLMFFFLKDGQRFLETASHYFPLPDAQERALFERFSSTVRAVVKGGLIVAIAQGLAGGILMWFVGIPHAALWGAVMAFLALLPFVGPPLVWGPAAFSLLLLGDITGAFILGIGGSMIIGTIDNILRPYLVGRDTRMPDALIFVSVIGGISMFGAGGIIMGPVVAALFLSVWQLFGSTGR